MQKRSIRELYALGEQACAEKDYSRAFEYFHECAERGDAGAQLDLGFMYSGEVQADYKLPL